MKYRFDEIAINSTEKKKPVEEDKYYYLGLEHLDPGQLKVSRFGSEVAPIGEKLIMKKGDVLFGKRRAYQKKVAIAPFDGIFSAHGMVLRPNEEVISKELFPFFISSDYFLDNAIRISVGSLSPTINWSDLRKLEFFLPAREEHDKLAELLWGIEENIEAYKKLIEATDKVIESQHVKMFKDYDLCKLEDFVHITMGQSPSSKTYNTEGQGVLFFQGKTDFGHKYVMGETYCTDPKKMAKAGDILISVRAPVGAVNITKTDCCIGRGLASLREIEGISLNEYIFHTMKVYEEELSQQGDGATFKAITKVQLSTFQIPKAPLNEQKRFVEFAEQAEESIKKVSDALEQIQSMKKAIIKKYFG